MSSENQIHPSVVIHPSSRIGQNVKIGAFSVIEENTVIGDNTTISDRVHICKGTELGKNNQVHMGAVIGHEAQHKNAKGIQSFLEVGDDNTFREYVTIHRGSQEGSKTVIGSRNFFMAFAHVGHDCHVEDDVTITNFSLVGGHVLLEHGCILSGASGVHQYCRIGKYAMIGGMASVTKDVPPYMLVDNGEELIGSINLIGLRRAGVSEAIKREVKNAYKLLYLSGLNTSQALESILQKCQSQEITHFVEFIRNSKRGILPHRRNRALFA